MKGKKRLIVNIGLALAAIAANVGMAPRVSLAAEPPNGPIGPVQPAHTAGIQGAGDDGGAFELGTWCIEDFPNPPDDRWGWCNSADSLRQEAAASGWTMRWNYRNSLAWEEDWKKSSAGGTENYYLDTVDLAYIATHGTTGVYDPFWGRYSSAIYYGVGGNTHDDAFLVPGDVYRSWGDWDAEWVAIDSCLVLNANDMGYWAAAMNGLHLIMGFDTIMLVTDHGRPFGQRVRWGWNYPQAWFVSAQLAMEPGSRWYNRSIRARVLAEEPCHFNDTRFGNCGDYAPNGYYHWWDYTFGSGPLFYSTAATVQSSDAVLQASDLPVLDVLSSLPTESDLSRLSGGFGFSPQTPAALDGESQVFRATDNTGLDLSVDQQGKYAFANLSKMYVVPTNTVSTTQALNLAQVDVRQIAQSYLQQRNLLPADAVFLEVLTDTLNTGVLSPITASVASGAGEVLVSPQKLAPLVAIDTKPGMYRVVYGRNITLTTAAGAASGIPVYGPGSRLTVYVTPAGEVSGVIGGWRSVNAAAASTAAGSPASARRASAVTPLSSAQATALFNALGDQVNLMPTGFNADVITVTQASVGYFEQPLGTKQSTLAPVYLLAIDLTKADQPISAQQANEASKNGGLLSAASTTLNSIAYVPGSVEALKPLARVVSPADNLISYGQAVTLTAADSSKTLAELGLGSNLTFSLGTAPFTYTWKLQNTGKVLGTGLSVTFKPSLEDFLALDKDASQQALVVVLEVGDAAGKTNTVTKPFSFVGSVPPIQKLNMPLAIRPAL